MGSALKKDASMDVPGKELSADNAQAAQYKKART